MNISEQCSAYLQLANILVRVNTNIFQMLCKLSNAADKEIFRLNGIILNM